MARWMVAPAVLLLIAGCLGGTDDANTPDADSGMAADATADGMPASEAFHTTNAGAGPSYMFLTTTPTGTGSVAAYDVLVPDRPEDLGGVIVEAEWTATTDVLPDGLRFELIQSAGSPTPGDPLLGIALEQQDGRLRAEVPADAWTNGTLAVRISAEPNAAGAGAHLGVVYHVYSLVFAGEPDWTASAITS